MRRSGPMLAAGAAGMMAGALLTLALQGGASPAEPGAPPAPSMPSPVPRTPEPPGAILAWTPGRLPDGFGAAVLRLPDVEGVAVVASGTAWLSASWSADGGPVDRPPDGLAIPLELAGVDALGYGRFLPPAERGVQAALAGGEVALGASSARLRGLG
ncbi:MAG TPA: hypothetical protein VEO00_05985, partial [Actinomycetota bacterium]|nr:hypothetical protein [Actinomycetota bacterium]